MSVHSYLPHNCHLATFLGQAGSKRDEASTLFPGFQLVAYLGWVKLSFTDEIPIFNSRALLLQMHVTMSRKRLEPVLMA